MTTGVSGAANVEEVAANLYRLRLPMPFGLDHINTYLLRETNRLALVDCGLDLPESWESLTAGFAALNLDPANLTDIFVTHAHPDHIGQLAHLRQLAPQARLFIHQREYHWLADRVSDLDTAARQMETFLTSNGETEIEAPRLVRSGIEMLPNLQSGDTLLNGDEHIELDEAAGDNWQILWTPGHTAGHFVLYNADRRLLLSGDHLLTSISSNIGKYPGSTDDPLGDFIGSLQNIQKLDLAQVLPAHGQPFANYRERVDTLIDHHRQRLEKIYATLEPGPRTAAEVVQVIWGERAKGFHRYLALIEALSHLERLRREGQVQREENDGLIRYQVA